MSLDPSAVAGREKEWQIHQNIANLANERGRLNEALDAYRAAADIAETLIRVASDKRRWQRNFVDSTESLGKLLAKVGRWDEVDRVFATSERMLSGLSREEPGNIEWRAALSTNYLVRGSALLQLERRSEGIRLLKEGRPLMLQVMNADQRYADWKLPILGSLVQLGQEGEVTGDELTSGIELAQRAMDDGKLSSEQIRNVKILHKDLLGLLGDMQIAEGDLGGSLGSYQASLTIVQSLAAAEPDNRSWQIDLASAQSKIGGVFRDQGNLVEAARNYLAARIATERLAAADPGNVRWRRILCDLYVKLGSLLSDADEVSDALTIYRAALGMAESVTRSNPTDTEVQGWLYVALLSIGDILLEQENLAEALLHFQKAQAIAERLVAIDPTDHRWLGLLCAAHQRTGMLLQTEGRFDEAVTTYHRALSIAERLAAMDANDALAQHGVSAIHSNLATLHRDKGEREKALAEFQQARAIMEQLTSISPEMAAWKDALTFYEEEIEALTQPIKRRSSWLTSLFGATRKSQ